MQAIRTVFLPATNSRGDRIKATAQAGNLTVSWNYGLGQAENHAVAALRLRYKLGWLGDLASGQLPDGSYAHVFIK